VAGFTCRFSGKLDSKGRVTVPARIRNRLDLEKGDKITLALESGEIIRKSFSSNSEALDFLSGLEGVESFSFDGEVLEVVLRD
jgi:AbrB family looped-hinge helix DNA binding protein